MLRQNSSTLFSVASNTLGAGSSMERQSSSVLFTVAGAASAAADAVKSLPPLYLKAIRAAEISVYGGELLVPSPLTAGSADSPSPSLPDLAEGKVTETHNLVRTIAKILNDGLTLSEDKSNEEAALTVAKNLISVSSSILNVLLAQDREGDLSLIKARQDGSSNHHNNSDGSDANLQSIGFTVLQLSALSLQCYAGASASVVTQKALGVRDAAAWIGLSQLLDKLASLSHSSTAKLGAESKATGSVDLFASTSQTAIGMSDRRALLLSVLPEVCCLLHRHLQTLLLRIDGVLSDNIHSGIAAQSKKSKSISAPSTATSPSKTAPVRSLNAFRNGTAATPTINSENVEKAEYVVRLGSIAPASTTLNSLQTAFVTLTRVLQILRHLSDTLHLSASLLQIQMASATSGGSEMSRQQSTVVTPLTQNDKDTKIGFESNHQNTESNHSELVVAKSLVQKASFIRILFASLQSYIQTVLGDAYNHHTTDGGSATKPQTKKSSNSAVAIANLKLRNQLSHQHLKLLQNLPASINLVPNSDDREILAMHLSSNCAYELISSEQLAAHQQQLLAGVTPSSAIACSLAAAAATTSGRYSANAAAPPHVARNRTAVASLMNLIHRRSKRSRRPLANALEMWSVFVPALVLDLLDDETKDDFLHSHHHHKQGKETGVDTTPTSSAVASPDITVKGDERTALLINDHATTKNNSHHGYVSSVQEAITYAVAKVALPTQFADAVRYWTLCNTVSASEGTSGSGCCSAISLGSLLTYGNSILGASLDVSALTVGCRLHADGLAWLRSISCATAAELGLYQQLSSTHASNQAAAAAAAAEQSQASNQPLSQSQSHSDPWHHGQQPVKPAPSSGGSIVDGSKALPKALHHHYQGHSAPTSAGQIKPTMPTATATTTATASSSSPSKPAAWGSNRVAAATAAAASTSSNHHQPTTPAPASASAPATNAWGAKSLISPITPQVASSHHQTSAPSLGPPPIAGSITSIPATPSASISAPPTSVWGSKIAQQPPTSAPTPSIWNDLPTLGSTSSGPNQSSPPPVRSFASILGAKK